MTQVVASPCVNICQMDDQIGLCIGCFRTIEEIAFWSRLSSDQRLKVLQAVERRRAEHDPNGCSTGGELRGECEREG